MNSIITNDGKCAGLYLHIKDSEFAIKMFTKFYNLSLSNKEYKITVDTAKDLIHVNRYNISKSNQIYVNDPETGHNILKSVNVGDYMIFVHETRHIYVFNKSEFKAFMNNNNYTKDLAVTYILGIDSGIEFKNMHMITANSLENAIDIYMVRYFCERPVCIGIVEDDHLNIFSDKHKFTVPLVM